MERVLMLMLEAVGCAAPTPKARLFSVMTLVTNRCPSPMRSTSMAMESTASPS